jgi:hypothetical protein
MIYVLILLYATLLGAGVGTIWDHPLIGTVELVLGLIIFGIFFIEARRQR